MPQAIVMLQGTCTTPGHALSAPQHQQHHPWMVMKGSHMCHWLNRSSQDCSRNRVMHGRKSICRPTSTD